VRRTYTQRERLCGERKTGRKSSAEKETNGEDWLRRRMAERHRRHFAASSGGGDDAFDTDEDEGQPSAKRYVF